MAEAFATDTLFTYLALITSIVALVVSVLSWRASARAKREIMNAKHAILNANQTAMFNPRYQVYEDAEKFVLAWQQQGRPDMTLLPMLIKAWNRSHFFFKPEVSQYLKRIWNDAVRAGYCREVMAGEAAGDRQAANKEFHALLKWHSDTSNLRAAFLPHLKIADGPSSSPKIVVQTANAPPSRPARQAASAQVGGEA